ncbi:hypothetical protein HHK36_012233 [Tetracentron sinense]|uniref:Uncharacterized protein n=1 Tax=Tetracentron sinense TaxID=13715 RepID=A0A834Z6H9_TETSI|nr:hypothetical protein HHK36_012233 [Tetracentron sinense]
MKTILILLIAIGSILATLQADARRFILEEREEKSAYQLLHNAHLSGKVGGSSTGASDTKMSDLKGKMGTNPMSGYIPTRDDNYERKLNSNNVNNEDDKKDSSGQGNIPGSTTDNHHVYPDDCRPTKRACTLKVNNTLASKEAATLDTTAIGTTVCYLLIFTMKTILILVIAMGSILATLQADAKRFILEEPKEKSAYQLVHDAHLSGKVGGSTGASDTKVNDLTGKMGTNPKSVYVPTRDENHESKLNSNINVNNEDGQGNPSGSTTDTHHVYPDDICKPKQKDCP